jgi:hypothetical protein
MRFTFKAEISNTSYKPFNSLFVSLSMPDANNSGFILTYYETLLFPRSEFQTYIYIYIKLHDVKPWRMAEDDVVPEHEYRR